MKTKSTDNNLLFFLILSHDTEHKDKTKQTDKLVHTKKI